MSTEAPTPRPRADGAVTTAGPVALIAGPCSVESRDQLMEVAAALKEAGVRILRGGAFKPRSSPYSFQGLEEQGLELLAEAAERYDLLTISEVVEAEQVSLVASYIDILQIGTRNMANFALLKRIGAETSESHQPVLFKRGMAATIEEWLLASEYLTMGGNPNVVLCERGIRTFETATRFTLDISAVPVVHKLSNLPVVVDVSHAVGHSDMVTAVSRAAVAVGADGLMVEVHPRPREALSDGAQSLDLEGFRNLMRELTPVAASVGREIA